MKEILPIGKKYGELTVVGEPKKVSRYRYARVVDNNGIERDIRFSSLKNGETLGVFNRHGLTKTHFFTVWSNMKARCLNKKDRSYQRYGGRGITYSKEWSYFINFYRDMSPYYKDGLTLERIDNNKGYSKENCRWATKAEQANNRSTNILFKGESIIECAKRLGAKPLAIYKRIERGWSLERSFNTPVKKYKARGKIS